MEGKRKVHKTYETSHLIREAGKRAGSSFQVETGNTYPAAQMSKNRARKGRGWELPGPDWQLQSASSSPAWQGDRHSRGCDGPPSASGGCRSNLAGKMGDPSRGCRRFDEMQQLCENICTNQVEWRAPELLPGAGTWGQASREEFPAPLPQCW